MVSLIAFGFPGRFKIRHFPLRPAVCLDKTAVGTKLQSKEIFPSCASVVSTVEHKESEHACLHCVSKGRVCGLALPLSSCNVTADTAGHKEMCDMLWLDGVESPTAG